MTTRIPMAQPFAHLLGLGKKPKAPAAQPKPAKAVTPKPTPRTAAPAKPRPRVRASDFSHLLVGPPPPPEPAPAPRQRSVAQAGGPQTAPGAVSSEADRNLAAKIVAAGRRRRGEA